jgi:hypothetical protein
MATVKTPHVIPTDIAGKRTGLKPDTDSFCLSGVHGLHVIIRIHAASGQVLSHGNGWPESFGSDSISTIIRNGIGNNLRIEKNPGRNRITAMAEQEPDLFRILIGLPTHHIVMETLDNVLSKK